MDIEKLLQSVEENIEKPFVTVVFGDDWKEHAKEHYDTDTLIRIAWKQGRRAILLERTLRSYASFGK